MTYDGINIGEAVQPIQDRVETYQSNGYAVINPGDALSAGAYAVTVNSGDLNASDTLTIGSSNDEILFDGSVKSLSSATNITINGVSAAGDGTEQYRYDVIYADSSGEVKKTEGSVTKLDSRESQNNLTRFERFKAAIPNPGTDPSVIIAAVIVNSNDTSVSTGQLRDYRVPATTTADTVDANTVDTTTTNTANLDGGVTGNTTISNIIGSGVEVVSGSLQAALGNGVSLSGNDITAALGDGLDFASGNIQILDSIWDAGNTELTADVNNTNITTDTLEADGAVIGGDYHYAGYYDGADVDARLDNALSAANDGDRIYLENATYSDNRTISKSVSLYGSGQKFNGTTLSGTITCNGAVSFYNMKIKNDITHNTGFATLADITFSGSDSVTVDDVDVTIYGCQDLHLTLTSNAKKCVVNLSASGSNQITDNGSNNKIGSEIA